MVHVEGEEVLLLTAFLHRYLPRPGIEPTAPALAGEFFTSEPPT